MMLLIDETLCFQIISRQCHIGWKESIWKKTSTITQIGINENYDTKLPPPKKSLITHTKRM